MEENYLNISIGDFIDVGRRCSTLYKKCKRDSLGDYKGLADEVGALHDAIKETEELLSHSELKISEQISKLDLSTRSCKKVLEDLDELVTKYESLGTDSRQTFDGMGFGMQDIGSIKMRLISNVTLLDALNSDYSHARLENNLNLLITEIRAGKREGSVVSTRPTDFWKDDATWEQLRRELEDIGILPLDVTEKRQFIIKWIQEAIATGKLGEESSEDDIFSVQESLSNEGDDTGGALQKTHFIVPVKWSDAFVGREEQLALLDTKLCQPGKYTRVAIVGFGGIGKTQLALQYLRQHRTSEISVYWIHAGTAERMRLDSRNIAKNLGIPGWNNPDLDILRTLKEWFESETSGTWLVVYDGADNSDFLHAYGRLEDFLPRSERGSILMTTRSSYIGVEFAEGKNTITLPGLTEAESSTLIAARLGENNSEYHERAKLAKTLGEIPQVIDLAISSIEKSESMTISQFLGRYKASHPLGLYLFGSKNEADTPVHSQSYHSAPHPPLEPLWRVDESLGFVDSAYGTASNGGGSHNKATGPTKLEPVEQEIDEIKTEYSEHSTNKSVIHTYMHDLADDLFAVVYTPQTDPKHLRRLCGNLTLLLQQFALRIGHEVPSKEGREVMYYVHQNRRRIVELFEQKWTDEHDGQECAASVRSDTVPFQEKISNWLTLEDPDANLPEEAVVAFPDEPELIDDSEGIGSDRYRLLVTKTSAYNWLLAAMGKELTLEIQERDILDSIHHEIGRGLPTVPTISIRRQLDPVTLLFRTNWNPAAFIKEQEYPEVNVVAMERAITLTGSLTDAQALSCVQYLRQTWPLSGEYTLRLLQKLMGSGHGELVQVDGWSDCSRLTAWRTSSAVYVEVSGSRSSIAEVGEQLAWLGSALRSSPFAGIASCLPYVDTHPWTQDEQDGLLRSSLLDSHQVIKINFALYEGDSDPENAEEGRCWHNLFRNPVVVRGFPILRRDFLDHGLEIPLNIMAGLVGTLRAHAFDNTMILKGFSSMLVPSKQSDGLIVWHVLFRANGSRISYLDYNFLPLQRTSFADIQTSRHLVGWCSHIKSHAGGPEANYDIERSRLPLPGAGCILEKASINAGKYVTAGLSFSIGVKDVPVHVPRKPYPQKLRSLSSKFFVFWDTEEKRGWLIDGVSALLHLVRATLKCYETDSFGSKLLSKYHDILEPSVSSDGAYPIHILLDEMNMKLPIYADKDDVEIYKDGGNNPDLPPFSRKKRFYRLEDRVEELYEVLEKLIDHQIDKAGQAGVKLKAHARRHLEGWDFKDLASDKDPIYPRGETLHATGKGWVDFIRSIQAVTLFGKGFGDIFQSLERNECPHWEQVPKGKFYLAACVSDLQQIMELEGDNTANPRRICHGILWFSPGASFDACQCAKTQSRIHSDPVQVLLPTSLTKRLSKQKKVHLHQKGAVIFGHNANFKWKWKDMGDPVEGDPNLEPIEHRDDISADVIGFTETSSSQRRSPATPNDSSTSNTSIQQSQTAEPDFEELVPETSEAVDHPEIIHTDRNTGESSAGISMRTSKRSALLRRMKGKLFS